MNNENKHNEDEDLKREAPLLFGLDKKEPYEAPDGYFEKFSISLSNKINEEKSQPWYSFLFRKVVFIPTTMVLIIATVFIFKPKETKTITAPQVAATEFSLDEISFDVLNTYVENNLLASVNTDEIIDLVGVEQMPAMNYEEVQPAMENIEEHVMEDYILDNIDDFDMDEIY